MRRLLFVISIGIAVLFAFEITYAQLGEGYSWLGNDREALLESCQYTGYDVKYFESNWISREEPECSLGDDLPRDGYRKLFPFYKDKYGKDGDTLVFYAIPREGGEKMLEKGTIGVWSYNEYNRLHIIKHDGLNGFYRCDVSLDICYLVLITKDTWSLIAPKDEIPKLVKCDADKVYIVVPEKILERWDQGHSDMEEVFNRAYLREGGENVLGFQTEGTHCWSDSGNNSSCTNGVWIRDYRNGDTETALIYNPDSNEAWLMSEVFWAYYKMIGGHKVLGAPKDNAKLYSDGAYRQSFQKGALMWSPWVPDGGYTYPEWQITMSSGSGNGNGSGNSGSGNGNGNGGGGEDPVDPYDPWEGYKNAVGIDSVRGSEEGEDDWEYVIEVPLGDIYDMDFRVKLKRKGGVWPDEVEASFYLSEDDVFDSGDVFLGSEDKDLSDEAEKKRSVYVDDVDMADFINEPGEYYVYVAVAYGTGTNRSTSRDKKERVKIIVTNETPLSDGTFIWSPDGPIAGMRCTQIYESQDPHFQNNYLCVPNESELNFVWSESGNMSDMYCVRTDEPKDKHSWDNNYLCWSDSGANGAGLSGIYYGAYDTVTTNTGATSPDVLPASIHLNDASGNVRAIYIPAEVPTLPGIAARIENIGALPSSAEQKHKLKTSVILTGPGYESGWKFSNTQTRISGFGTAGYEENISFALPSDAVLNEGLYSIVVSTDETDKLIESNELNNTSPQVRFWVQNALPDIAVQALSVDDDLTEVKAGSKHDITIDVGNIAPVGGDAHFPVVVQLWYDGDQLLGEQVIDAADLIAGGSTEVTISGWTVPFEEGAHTLTATATNKFVPYEANLSNNTLAQNITITVTPGDPDCVIVNPMETLPATGGFDLAATAISFPDTLKWGESLHPWAEQCTISGRSPETRAMWAYARCDGTGFTPFDDDGNDGMKAGQCGAEQVYTDRNLSTMDPGMYMIYFISNGTTQVPESDHSNNVQAKAFLLEE